MHVKSGSYKLIAKNSHTRFYSVPVTTDGILQKEPFLVVDKENSATVIARNENNEILLVKQHRFAIDKISWELPQGSQEEGETLLATACREFKEETGYLIEGELNLVGTINEAADWCTTTSNVYYIDKVKEVGGSELLIGWQSQEQIISKINNGELFDAPTLAALYLYQNVLESRD